MKAALTDKTLPYPSSWADIPNGDEIRQLISAELREASRKFFGYHLVRLGNLSSGIELVECPIKHKVNISRKLQANSAMVCASDELALAENSVDAFLLINELDFSSDPHQVLREVVRAIIPNGHLVVVGFNPFSLCGLFKYLPFQRRNVLHHARFFSLLRVKDWLQLLGFEITMVHHKVFSEVFFGRRLAPRSKWLKWCEQYFGWCAGLYIIEARKREIPLSLVKPKWHAKPKFSSVGATTASWYSQPIDDTSGRHVATQKSSS
jgi:SAM-dependent methyltransferase